MYLTYIVPVKLNSASRTRIVCFPFAGGGVSVYRTLFENVTIDAEVLAVLLPGRESRFSEAFVGDFETLVENISKELEEYNDKSLIFFGHSMGAVLAFETAACLFASGNDLVSKVFVSGARAPHLRDRDEKLHALSDKELFERLYSYGGMLSEIADNKQLVDLVLPIVRSDLSLIENYQCREGALIPCPILALSGFDDPEVSRPEVEAWEVYTSGPFSCRFYPGDHFFIKVNKEEIISLLSMNVVNF